MNTTKHDLDIPAPTKLERALANLITGEDDRTLDQYWEEADIAWHEGGHADEAQYDRAKENSRDEWEMDWVEAELRADIAKAK